MSLQRSVHFLCLFAVLFVLGPMCVVQKNQPTAEMSDGGGEASLVAEQLFTDTDGSAWAAAAREYMPTDDDVKLATSVWAIASLGVERGIIPKHIGASDLFQRTAAIAKHWPSFFEADGTPKLGTLSLAAGPGSSSLGVKSQALSEYSCTEPCELSSDKLNKGLKKVAKEALKKVAEGVGPGFKQLVDVLCTSESVTSALLNGLDTSSTEAFAVSVAEQVSTSLGVLKLAAVALGLPAEATAGIAIVGTTLTGALIAYYLSQGYDDALQNATACEAYHAENCTCSQPGVQCCGNEGRPCYAAKNEACTTCMGETKCRPKDECCPGESAGDESCCDLSGSGTPYRCDAGLKCRACNGGAERCIPQDAFCCSDPDASFGSFCTGEKQCKVCPGQKTRCVGGPTIDCCFANYDYCKADQECSKCPGAASYACVTNGSCESDAGEATDSGTVDGTGGAPNDAPNSVEAPAAVSWGDPHLETFDGVLYDLQVVGELMLVTNGADFVVQVRQQPYFGSTTIAMNTAVAAKIGGHRVAFYADQNPLVRIDGTPTTVSGTLALAGGGSLALTGSDYTLTWPDGSTLTIHPSIGHLNAGLNVTSSYAGKLSGLLGNFDAKNDDDLKTRSGTLIETPSAKNLYTTYADSWRIAQAESLFDYAAGESTATFTDKSFPSAPVSSKSLSATQLANAQAACAKAGVVDKALLEACLLDVGMTGDIGFADEAANVRAPSIAVHVNFLDFESPVAFIGTWSGTCGGAVSGTFTMNIAPDGSVTGGYSGSASGTLSGSVSQLGSLQASGSAGACTWSGQFGAIGLAISGSGTWDCGGGCSGTWGG